MGVVQGGEWFRSLGQDEFGSKLDDFSCRSDLGFVPVVPVTLAALKEGSLVALGDGLEPHGVGAFADRGSIGGSRVLLGGADRGHFERRIVTMTS